MYLHIVSKWTLLPNFRLWKYWDKVWDSNQATLVFGAWFWEFQWWYWDFGNFLVVALKTTKKSAWGDAGNRVVRVTLWCMFGNGVNPNFAEVSVVLLTIRFSFRVQPFKAITAYISAAEDTVPKLAHLDGDCGVCCQGVSCDCDLRREIMSWALSLFTIHVFDNNAFSFKCNSKSCHSMFTWTRITLTHSEHFPLNLSCHFFVRMRKLIAACVLHSSYPTL